MFGKHAIASSALRSTGSKAVLLLLLCWGHTAACKPSGARAVDDPAKSPAQQMQYIDAAGRPLAENPTVCMSPRLVVGSVQWQLCVYLASQKHTFVRTDLSTHKMRDAWPVPSEMAMDHLSVILPLSDGDVWVASGVDETGVETLRLKRGGGVESWGKLPTIVVAAAQVDSAVEVITSDGLETTQLHRRKPGDSAWTTIPVPPLTADPTHFGAIQAARSGPAGWTLWALTGNNQSPDLAVWQLSPGGTWQQTQTVPKTAGTNAMFSYSLDPSIGNRVHSGWISGKPGPLRFDGQRWHPNPKVPTEGNHSVTVSALIAGRDGPRPSYAVGGGLERHISAPDGRWLQCKISNAGIQLTPVGAPPGPTLAKEASLCLNPVLAPAENGEYILLGAEGLWIRLDADLKRIDQVSH